MPQKINLSVCIPTYKRLDLLQEALGSCLAQTSLPYEILIGDNSPDDRTQDYIEALIPTCPVAIRYFHHVPSLTQAQNVDHLFDQVRGEVLLLLHDDDTFEADYFESIQECFRQHPGVEVIFGKQYMMSNEGEINHALSTEINEVFFRTPPYAGEQLTPLESAMVQQFPNDCFAIKSSVAKQLRYDSTSKHACDFEFALKVGRAGHRIYFLDKYTASYRLSADAVSGNNDNNASLIIYQLIERLAVPPRSAKYQAQILKTKAPVAVAQAANLKQGREAARIFFSKWNRKNLLTSNGLKGVYHLVKAFL